MSIYTIAFYKEAGYDTRYQEFYQSGFDLVIFETPEEASNEIFRYLKLRREGKEANDYDWEWRLLIDGKDEDWWLYESHADDYYKNNPFIDIRNKAEELFKEWEAEANARKEAERIAEEAKRKRSEAATAAAQTRHEKALLKTLKEKYPNE